MPSLRSCILGLALVLPAFVQLSSATPLPADLSAECVDPPSLPSKPSVPTPTLPLTGGATELPTTNQTLVYVALGRGVQNYTCASTTAAPVALGAIATLFDGTSLCSANEAAFNALPPKAVYLPLTSLPPPISTLKTLGHHYFGADGTPTFDLTSVKKILFAKKTGDIKAPANANVGPGKTGAVDWLQLVSKPGYASSGLQTVYRVVTAGGNPPTACTTVGVISVQYAAEYWFYN